MLSSEDKQEIKKLLQSILPEMAAKAAEINLLAIPETVGNMLKEQAIQANLSAGLYDKHKEFKPHRQTVRAVIEKIDSDNPGMAYEDVVEAAIPIIKKQIAIGETLDMKNVDETPRIDFNGVI